jgi:hypothetical protein
MDGLKLGFGAALVFSLVAACATGGGKGRGNHDDDEGGGGSTGAMTSGNGAGGGGSGSCTGYCAKESAAACELEDPETCMADCATSKASVPPQCTASYDTLLACAAGPGTVACDVEGTAQISGCDPEFQAMIACVNGSSTTSTSSGGGATCYDGQGTCSPITGGCATGEACDVSSNNTFACFPPPNDAPTGATCNNMSGPFCQNGNYCDTGICRAYCCSTNDCGTGACQMVTTAGSIVIQVCK